MRFPRFIAFFLAIVAIVIIGHDYCAGHMDAKPWDIVTCPLCKSYVSTESVSVFDVDSFRAGILCICSFVEQYESPHVTGVRCSLISRRGPPPSSC